MLRVARGLTIAVAAFGFFTAPALAQESVAGRWLFSIDSPDAGMIEVPFTFQQDGTVVTGTVDLSVIAQVQATEITDGVFQDGVLSFLLHVGAEGEWITVEVEADVDGDEMEGEAYIADMAQISPFTAKRSTPG